MGFYTRSFKSIFYLVFTNIVLTLFFQNFVYYNKYYILVIYIFSYTKNMFETCYNLENVSILLELLIQFTFVNFFMDKFTCIEEIE